MVQKFVFTLFIVFFQLSLQATTFNNSIIEGQEGETPIIFIVDGSGSMWGKVQDEFKIVIARTVMKELVGNISSERPLGLVVYGHRRKSDCADVEYMVKPTAGSQASITNTLDKINPTGKTPLAVSVKMVIDDLMATKTKATIILVTDGIETCEGNLCELVAEAQKNGIEFKMHIVGFDLEPEAKANLECAAAAGQGQYFDATNSEELSNALNTAVEENVDNDAYNLTVRGVQDGKLVDTWVQVFREGEDASVGGGRTYDSENSNPTKILLEPGKYRIKATLIKARGVVIEIPDIVIPEEGIVEKEVDFSTGKISIGITNNGDLWDSTVKVVNVVTGENVAGGRSYTSPNSNPAVYEIPPGTYDVTVRGISIEGMDHTHKIENVVVKPSETSKVAHDYQTGVFFIKVMHNGELLDATTNVIHLESRTSVGGSRTYTSESSNPRKFILNPGKYQVKVRPVKIKADYQTLDFTIEAGQTVNKTMTF
ncbi:MAG: VWA domain-containing protein [Chitinophagales bacterium]